MVRLSRTVVYHALGYPGWRLPGVVDWRWVLEMCVHVVRQRRYVGMRCVFRKLGVGVHVNVPVLQVVTVGFLFHQV